MDYKIKHLILSALLAIPLAMGATGKMVLHARIDTAAIVMGETTTLHLELAMDKGVNGYFLNDKIDTLCTRVEINSRPKPDTIDLGNNRIQINKDYLIQSFDSGRWAIPPLLYIAGPDTARTSENLALTVSPVKVNEQGDIKDFAPPEEPPRHFLDWVPDWVPNLWWLWLLLLLAAVAAWYYHKYMRKGKNPFKHEKKRLPPYEEAMQRLHALRARQLWQNNQEKAYYTELTDILRVYIDRRLNINAVEMTSSQIIDSLRQNPDTKVVNDQLSEILAVADFVKFAGQHPLADDNERSMARAENFVEATKPIVAEEEEEAPSKEKKEVSK